jgi:1-acyl-sn-glycerol-3-phosphate acyltransferase
MLLIFYPVFWILLLNDKHYNLVFRVKVVTAKFMLFFQGIWHKNLNKTDKLMDESYVICVNHTSYLDIIFLFTILNKHRFLYIGKKELASWPIMGIFFRKLDISIDRRNPREALKAIIKAKERLKQKWSIVIFPEGTIPKDVPNLGRFKNGAFKMAIETQKSILPITVLDNWKLLRTSPFLTAPARPGRSRVIIHDPIPTTGMTQKDLVSLRDKTYDIINAPLIKYHGKALKQK